MNKIIFIVFLLLFYLCYSSNAQDSSKSNKVIQDFFNYYSEVFEFNNPDTGFIPLVDNIGFSNSRINSQIKYVPIPTSYQNCLKEFSNHQSNNDYEFVDSFSLKGKNGESIFFIFNKHIPPINSGYENLISITSVIEYQKDFTLSVVGVYPQSADKRLKQKFIDAAISIRHKN